MKPYDADEVYRTLNQVAAFDWKGFFETRLRSKSAALPLGGVEGGGYRLVYTARRTCSPTRGRSTAA